MPFIRAKFPVSHVEDSSVSSGSSGGELSELNDLSTSLLDSGSELVLKPVSINEGRSGLSVNSGVSNVGVHGGRVVSPDSHLGDVVDGRVGLQGKLGKSSVVVESGHGSEVFPGNSGSVVGADQSVGVSRVSNNNSLGSSLGVVIDGLSSSNEDLSVILKQVSSLHAGSSGLGADEEVVIDILETN